VKRVSERFAFDQPSKMYRFDGHNPQENDVLRVIYLNTKLNPLAYRDFKIENTSLSNPEIKRKLMKRVAEDAVDFLSKSIILSLTREITPPERDMIKELSKSIGITGATVLDTIFRPPEMRNYISLQESPGLFESYSHIAETYAYGLTKTKATLVSEFIEGRWNGDGNLDYNLGKNDKPTVEEEVALAYDFMSKEDQKKVVDHLESLSKSEVEVGTIIGFSKGELINIVEVAKGGVNAAIIDTTVVFKRVREMKADGFIFAHNHPSGAPTPSKDDVLISERLKKGSEVLGITYIDSAIVGEKILCSNVGMFKNSYSLTRRMESVNEASARGRVVRTVKVRDEGR